MTIVVTTSRNAKSDLVRTAEEIANELGVEYLKRGKTRLDEYYSQGIECLVNVCPQKISVLTFKSVSETEEFFFHPNMALLRIKRIKSRGFDFMVEAMGILTGDEILDCTLGMGSDAIVASYVTGAQGRVVALESSSVISAIVRRGLLTWPGDIDHDILEAMKRIEVINVDYSLYLDETKDKFDIVYFDPMFENLIQSAQGINPMRRFAKNGGVDIAAFDKAKEIAKKTVVVKVDAYGDELERLKILNTIGHRNGSFEYGVLRRVFYCDET